LTDLSEDPDLHERWPASHEEPEARGHFLGPVIQAFRAKELIAEDAEEPRLAEEKIYFISRRTSASLRPRRKALCP
jgi:hypothetical protein